METITITEEDLRPGFYAKAEKTKCYACKYRNSVPGSAHSSCSKTSAFIRAEDHGIKMGWVMWPFDFDPVWITACDSFFPKAGLTRPEGKDRLEQLTIAHVQYQMKKFKSLADKNDNFSLVQAHKLMNDLKPIIDKLEAKEDKDFFPIYESLVEL